jgi:RNA polymerase sigma factor (TIGR02999 family)
MAQPGDITRLLQHADEGDRDAAGRLFSLVEEDLKVIARKRKRSAPAGFDVSTTLLVDEAFLRLVGQDASTWEPGDHRKFFGYASKQIHELLIKTARADRAAKRGGGQRRVDLDEGEISERRGRDLDMQLDLKDALERFERFAPDDALLFRVRYFLGCTFDEAAELLGISATEAKRSHERARLWLEGELEAYRLDS